MSGSGKVRRYDVEEEEEEEEEGSQSTRNGGEHCPQ